MQREPLTNEHGEVRELTGDDLRHFRNAGDALPAAVKKDRRSMSIKEPTTSPEIDPPVASSRLS